jgi:hypothetical protein
VVGINGIKFSQCNIAWGGFPQAGRSGCQKFDSLFCLSLLGLPHVDCRVESVIRRFPNSLFLGENSMAGHLGVNGVY